MQGTKKSNSWKPGSQRSRFSRGTGVLLTLSVMGRHGRALSNISRCWVWVPLQPQHGGWIRAGMPERWGPGRGLLQCEMVRDDSQRSPSQPRGAWAHLAALKRLCAMTAHGSGQSPRRCDLRQVP